MAHQGVRFMVVALAGLIIVVGANPEPASGMSKSGVTQRAPDRGPHSVARFNPPWMHSDGARPTPIIRHSVGVAASDAGVLVPIGQTFGGAGYGVNPTSVESDVNSLDGALEVSHTDIRVAGIGVPFVLDRQYNSRDVGTLGAFGPGWSSILDLAVRFSANGGRAVVYGEDGQQAGFTYDSSNNSWIRDPGVRTSLSCSGPATNNVAPGTCTVTRFSDGVNWTLSQGKVQNFRTAAGQGLTFGYKKGKITRVTVESTAKTPLVILLTRSKTGLVTKLTTPTRSVSYGYDKASDLSAVTDANGDVWRLSYAKGHLLTGVAAYPSATATSGVTILTAQYNSKTGRVSAAVERLGSLMHDTTFGWSGKGESGQASRNELMEVNGGAPARVTYIDTYANGLLTQKLQPLGEKTAYQYDANMDLTQLTNPLGSTQTMTYDADGDELSTSTNTDSTGDTEVETFTYDSLHHLTSITEPVTLYLTDKTTYVYNGNGELASTTSSGAGTTTYAYNKQALPVSQTDGDGNVTSYAHDAYGNLTGESVKSPSGAKPEGFGPVFAYNESGEQVLSVPAIGNMGGGRYVAADATRTSYTPDGQETKIITPDGAVSTTSYDAAGDVVSTGDPNGNETTFSWSKVPVPGGYDWQETTTNPAGTTVDVYDPSGNVLSSTPPQPAQTMSGQPAGVVTNVYNADGEVTVSTNGQGVSTTYTRDGLGDVIYSGSRDVVTAATYNLVGWATSASTTTNSYPPDSGTPGQNPTTNTTTTHTSYGLVGQVEEVTDTAGGSVGYFYGPGDLVNAVEDRNGITQSNYDNNRDVTSVMSAAGDTTDYTYDALGHETSQTIGSQTWTISYDADGNAVKTIDPDGRTALYTFDAMNRKTGVTYKWADGTGNGEYAAPVTWTYNTLGQRTQMTDGVGTTSYTYDSQGRLLTADTATLTLQNQDFSYDYAAPGQFSETYPDGATVTYHTDDGGNLMGVSVPAQSDGSPAFATGNMLPTTAVTQGSSNSATAGSSTGAVTPIAPSGTLYPDMLIGYTFNEPHTNSAGTPTLTGGTAFYSAAMADATTSSNPEPPQGVYIAESDINGNLLSEQWATLPAPGATVGSEMTMEYGYNDGALGSAVDENSSNGGDQGGVQLTSWSSSYSTSQTQDQETGSFAYNGDGNPTMITTGAGGAQGLAWALYYDGTGEISSVWTNAPNPANTPDTGPNYAYDNAGNVTQAGAIEPPGQTLQQAGTQWKFLYNDAGQIAIATETEPDRSIHQINYTYDGDGNLASEEYLTCCSYNEVRNISLIWDPRPSTPQLVEADDTPFVDGNPGATIHSRYFWGNGLLGMEAGGSDYVFHDNQNGTPTMVTNTSGQTVDSTYYDPHGNFLDGFNVSGETFLIGFDGSYSDPITGLDLMGARWYVPDLGIFMSRASTSPPTPGTAVAVSDASSQTIGMSASPGTSPLAPVSPPATGYGFGAGDPTNHAQPTGTTATPATTGDDFQGLSSEGAYSDFETVKPYAFGTLAAVLVKAPGKIVIQRLKALFKTQTPEAAEQSAGGSEVAAAGSADAEEGLQAASDANDVEDATASIADGVEASGTASKLPGVGNVLTFAAMAASVYLTVEACGEYGSTSRQCIGEALGTALSFAAQGVCEVVTDGAGTAGCGILQSVIQTVVPLAVEGDGQSFLNSVTISSGYGIQDANVLTAQYLIAGALWPIGTTVLLGELVYANYAAIESGFVTAGNAIASAYATAGQAFINVFETAANAIISGVSTAGAYAASGFQTLVAELQAAGLTNLANELSNTATSSINDIAGQVGSALCDVESTFECLNPLSIFIVRLHDTNAARLHGAEAASFMPVMASGHFSSPLK